MSVRRGIIIICLFIIVNCDPNTCGKKEKCDECIQDKDCYWCADLSLINGTHCFSMNDDKKCPDVQKISPESTLEIIKDKELQGDTDKKIVTIKPQEINLKLRKGEEYNLNFEYLHVPNLPMDLYYLMDLSASMRNQKDQLASLGTELIKTMQNLTTDFKIGFGSFVEKSILPYVSTVPEKLIEPCSGCTAAYSFKNHMSLTSGEGFSENVRNAKVSGNLDSPESGMDALMQVMVCDIGWRQNSRKIIVYSSDAGFHIAGDGKLAGIVEPNDGKCHLDSRNETHTTSLIYDYPSLSQINHQVQSKEFNIFFAIVNNKENVLNLYKELNEKIIKTSYVREWTELSKPTDDIVDFYKRITEKVEMEFNANDGISINFEPDCGSKIANGCANVKDGDAIKFRATIKAETCSNGSVRISPKTLNSELRINLEVICECDCINSEKHPEMCNNNGEIECGICECNQGFHGQICECDGDNDDAESEKCKMNSNDTITCNGRGDCICGRCNCDDNTKGSIYGSYCECDNFSCPKSSGRICNRNGKCDCGVCKCNTGWIGDSCDCYEGPEPCTRNGKVCSDHGVCVCGNCKCNEGYFGNGCEECATCSRCDELSSMVECFLFNTSSTTLEDSCNMINNKKYQITKTEELFDNVPNICTAKVNNCTMLFNYVEDSQTGFLIQVKEELECSTPINVLALVFGIIGGILLIGILTLIIWKIATDIHDRKEYARFDEERKKANWNINENPLFKSPVGEFINPNYNKGL